MWKKRLSNYVNEIHCIHIINDKLTININIYSKNLLLVGMHVLDRILNRSAEVKEGFKLSGGEHKQTFT
jgi:hypothetical protein